MGYNANLTKVGSIPAKRATAGTNVLHVITAALDQRITVPYLSVRNAAADAVLSVLQTEGVYRFTQGLAASANVIVPGIPAGISNRYAVIRDQDGINTLFRISAQTGETLTLDNPIPANTRCMLYLLGNGTSPHTASLSLENAGTTVFETDCPGAIAGRELGWPIGLLLENGDGSAEIEGGMVAYIGV